MFGRPRESLCEFIRLQHEESKRYQEKRDEESKLYWEERDEYWKRRDEEFERYWEEREEKSRAREAELHELRRAAEARQEETREFNREILLRNEKVYKVAIAEMEEGRKQIQANTKAVLSVLDRINGSDGLAA